MKFTVTMKHPDALHDAIAQAVESKVALLGLAKDEAVRVAELRAEKVRDVCGKWFHYGELVSIEIDTDAGTATVVPR